MKMEEFNFKGLVTLTLDQVIWHTVVHHSTNIPNFIGIGKTFCGRTDGPTSETYLNTLLGRLFGVDLKTTSMVVVLHVVKQRVTTERIN